MNKAMFFIAIGLLFLSGCSDEGDVDFCRTYKDSYLAQNRQITEIKASVTDNASLTVTIQTPEQELLNRFQAADFSPVVFNDRSDCKLEDRSLSAEQVRISYACNTDNGRLKHIVFNLLDKYPSVDEVKVSFTTPAVTKNYLLHRMCPKPLFL